jgi:hypothetical protein
MPPYFSHFQVPVYRADGSIKMQNEKCKMQNEGVAFGDYFNHFPEENTTILHYALCILHS